MCTVLCKLCSVCCVLFTVLCLVYTKYCVLSIVYCLLCTVHCTLYSVHYVLWGHSVHSVHCTLGCSPSMDGQTKRPVPPGGGGSQWSKKAVYELPFTKNLYGNWLPNSSHTKSSSSWLWWHYVWLFIVVCCSSHTCWSFETNLIKLKLGPGHIFNVKGCNSWCLRKGVKKTPPAHKKTQKKMVGKVRHETNFVHFLA